MRGNIVRIVAEAVVDSLNTKHHGGWSEAHFINAMVYRGIPMKDVLQYMVKK